MRRFAAVLVVLLAACPQPCGPLPPSPPRDPACTTTDFHISLGAFPDTGDLSPDYLVASNTTVTAVATAIEDLDCRRNPNNPNDVTKEVRRPDFSWKLELIPRGGIKVDVTSSLASTVCLDPTFVAKRGTWRLTFWLTQQPVFAKTITIEAADPEEWLSIGPDGRLLDGSGWTGRISAVAFDPVQSGLMYAAAPFGGVFRSDGGGDFWYPMSDHKIVDGANKEWRAGLNTSRVVVLQNGHVVVSTCDTDGPQEGCDPGHLFYTSTDGGVSWTQSGTNCTNAGEADVPTGPVLELVVNQAHGSLYTVAGGSVYRSRSEGNCWHKIDPPAQLTGGLQLIDAAVQRRISKGGTAGDNLYVAAMASNDTKTARTLDQILFMTTNSEQLDPTWQAATLGTSAKGAINTVGSSSIERVQLASSGAVVYALVPVNGASLALQLYRASAVAPGLAPTWEMKASPPTSCWGQCTYYDLAIAVNEYPRTNVSAGDELAVAGTSGVVRSIDGGSSWTGLGELHVDHHFLAFDADGRLWDTSDGGLASIEFPSGSWLARTYGLATTMAYNASISAADKNHDVTGEGLQDNGNFIRKQKGRVWDRVSGCDGFQVYFDAVNNKIAYEGPLNCGRALYRLDLAGNVENGLGSSQFFESDTYRSGRLHGINPTGSGPYSLYLADGLDTQAPGPVSWRCADPQPTLTNEFVTSTLVLPGDRDRIYVANSAGDVYRTDTTQIVGTATCGSSDTAGDAIYTTQPASKMQITKIALDQADTGSMYLTEARGDANRVVHLVFDGKNWTPTALAQNYPSTPYGSFERVMWWVQPIASDPLSPSTVFTGTELGVIKGSSTANAAWNSVLSVPNTWVTALMTAEGPRCDPKGIVRAATFGRGVWQRFFPLDSKICPLQFRPGPGKPPREPNIYNPFWWLEWNPAAGEGPFDPAVSVRVNVEYVWSQRGNRTGSLRATALRDGKSVEQVRAKPVDVKPGHGYRVMQLDFLGDGGEIFTTDSLRLELYDGDQLVGATTQEGRLQFRSDTRRTLRVSASLLGEGGSRPISDVEVSVAGQAARTPRIAALARGRGVAIEAPEFVTLPGGERASFAGWVGSSHKLSDWSRRQAVAGNPTSRRIELPLADDSDIDLHYRTNDPDRELELRQIRPGRR